jgi:hypothetical protein
MTSESISTGAGREGFCLEFELPGELKTGQPFRFFAVLVRVVHFLKSGTQFKGFPPLSQAISIPQLWYECLKHRVNQGVSEGAKSVPSTNVTGGEGW